MVFLEIEHPDRDRVVLPLREGVFLFPPSGLIPSSKNCRLRLHVRGDQVQLEALSEGVKLRQGNRDRETVRLIPGQSVQVQSIRLTLKSGSQSLLRRGKKQPVLQHSVGATETREPRPVRRPRRSHRRVSGHNRWVLMSLFAAGRIGRRDIARVVIIDRNDREQGIERSAVDILKKPRFLGSGCESAIEEVTKGTVLKCRECQRVFEPEAAVIGLMKCLECDRRLTCFPRAAAEIDPDSAASRSPSRMVTSYDRLMRGMRLGDYKIEQLLGVGGYGAVYKSFDTRLQRTVALKVFPAGREGIADVLREARNVAAFPPHHNLVLVYHVGQALGFDYICYEYVSGRSLAYHLDRRTKIDVRDCLRLMRDVLTGLAEAHDKGVIHRDLKPDNVLLVRVEGQFRARITDFGLGQRLRAGQGAYHSRTIRGAPEYLAPEQFQTQISSAASDLYSFGATFYHVLTGQAPFAGDSDFELAERHVEDPVPSLAGHLRSYPPSLELLIRLLLAKDPKSRPVSAKEALKLLGRAEHELERGKLVGPARGGRWMSVTAGVTIVAVAATLFFHPSWSTQIAERLGWTSSDPVVKADTRNEESGQASLGTATPAITPPPEDSTGAGSFVETNRAAVELPGIDADREHQSANASGVMSSAPLVPAKGLIENEAEEIVAGNPTELDASDEESTQKKFEDLHPAAQDLIQESEYTEPEQGFRAGSVPSIDPEQSSEETSASETEADVSAARVPSESSSAAQMQSDGMMETSGASLDSGSAEAQNAEPLIAPVPAGVLRDDWFRQPDGFAKDISQWLERVQQDAELEGLNEKLTAFVELFQGCTSYREDDTDSIVVAQCEAQETLSKSTTPLADVEQRFYSSDQVLPWLEDQLVMVRELGFGEILTLRIPTISELESLRAQQSELFKDLTTLEWVVNADGKLVAFNHASGSIRRGSEGADFYRLSSVRLIVTVLDLEAFRRQLETLMSNE